MAHGTRGRLIRTAATGLGVLLCSGLVGCWNADKPRENGLLKKAGLPGTPLLPGSGTGTTMGKTGQPAGTAGQVRTGTGTGATSGVPLGGGFGNSTNFSAQSGNPGAIGAPTQPGFVPSVAPSGYQPYQPTGTSGTPGGAYSASPPAPTLSTVEPLPPGPPSYPAGAGIDPAGGVQPLAPVSPPMSPPGGFGK